MFLTLVLCFIFVGVLVLVISLCRTAKMGDEALFHQADFTCGTKPRNKDYIIPIIYKREKKEDANP